MVSKESLSMLKLWFGEGDLNDCFHLRLNWLLKRELMLCLWFLEVLSLAFDFVDRRFESVNVRVWKRCSVLSSLEGAHSTEG